MPRGATNLTDAFTKFSALRYFLLIGISVMGAAKCHVVYVALVLSNEQRLMELIMVKVDELFLEVCYGGIWRRFVSPVNSLGNPCGF